MQHDSAVTAIAHVIQLAVAPVFLLSGIGAMLAVLTNRLSRVIERARILEDRLAANPADPHIHGELTTLSRRAILVSRSITLCTITALLICVLIAALFLGAFFSRFDATVPVGVLFLAAMASFFLGLLSFLREIFVATASLRIGPR